MDLWAKAETPVLAALDGKVHSFNYNAGIGNYGPTIILEHKIHGHTLYTLYGHLAMESIEDIEIGDTYKEGQQLATLGDAAVNGDYAPHLHLQIILDIEDHFGDYPGVCTKSDLDHYLKNCPDPNLLLKLK
jgi:murein DD-endopeptidase MepM/ murein hydrolase activator NlpD